MGRFTSKKRGYRGLSGLTLNEKDGCAEAGQALAEKQHRLGASRFTPPQDPEDFPTCTEHKGTWTSATGGKRKGAHQRCPDCSACFEVYLAAGKQAFEQLRRGEAVTPYKHALNPSKTTYLPSSPRWRPGNKPY